MPKSYLKQIFLSVICGPLGLSYSSINTSLSLTLLTLIFILVFSQYDIEILVASVPVAVALGIILVRSNNNKSANREFQLSTYIGRVSCRIAGKKPIQRDYHKALRKTRRLRKFNIVLNSALAVLCILVSSFIAAPELSKHFKKYTETNANIQAEPLFAARTEKAVKDVAFSDSGRWQVATDNGKRFSATLRAEEYHKTSEGWYRPTITISCIANKTKLIFESSEVLGTGTTMVSLSFTRSADHQGNTKQQKAWQTTSDYRSALAPNPIGIARQLARKKFVEVQFKPFGREEPNYARFNLENTHQTVVSIRKRCAW